MDRQQLLPVISTAKKKIDKAGESEDPCSEVVIPDRGFLEKFVRAEGGHKHERSGEKLKRKTRERKQSIELRSSRVKHNRAQKNK